MERKTISVFELSKTLGISKSLAYSLIRRNEIEHIKVGEKRIIIPLTSVQKFLENVERKGDSNANR